MDINKLNVALGKMLAATREVNTLNEFKALLGGFVDFWSAEHGVSERECLSIFEDLAEIQKGVHSIVGGVKDI